jgi:hypothetical protein
MQNFLLHAISLKLLVWAVTATVPWIAIYAISHEISGLLRSHQAFRMVDFGCYLIGLFILAYFGARMILRRSTTNRRSTIN